jgi:hypothetical protein
MNTRIVAPAALLGLLLVGGCDSDAAQLAKEITDARGDCTQEKLKAGDEACVAMMEKYATMGTSAIQTYIGAVKSMDQALERMPPAAFDTAGIGHAFTPAAAADSSGLRPAGFSASRSPGSQYYLDGDDIGSRGQQPAARGSSRYSDPRDPNQQYRGDSRSPAPRYADPRYPEARDADTRYADPRYPDSRGLDPRYADPRDQGNGNPRYDGGASRGDPYDARGASRARPGAGDDDRAPARAPAASPGRGLLLPPDQRLQRPWLRPQQGADTLNSDPRRTGRNEDLRAERSDGYLPSRPLQADSLDPRGAYRDRDWRSDGY